MAVLFTASFGAMSIVWDREFGFLEEVLVALINRAAAAVGKTLGGATQAMLQLTPLDRRPTGSTRCAAPSWAPPGFPSRVPDSLGLTLFGKTLAIWMEEGC